MALSSTRTAFILIAMQFLFFLVMFSYFNETFKEMKTPEGPCIIVNNADNTKENLNSGLIKRDSLDDSARRNYGILDNNRHPTIPSKPSSPIVPRLRPDSPPAMQIGPVRYKTNRTPRLLFSINSGRSGSGYLSKVLQGAAIARVFHEGLTPQMSGGMLLNTSKYGLEETKNKRMAKVTSISKYLRGMQLDTVHADPLLMYAETSHFFYKNFEDIVMEQYLPKHHIYVVMLTRYLPLVLSSLMSNKMWEVGCEKEVPLSYSTFRFWYYNPAESKIGITKPDPPPSCANNATELAMAYLIDVHMHQERFRQKYQSHPNVTIVDVRLEDLQTEEGIYKFYEKLDISRSVVPDANQRWLTKSVVGKSYNERKPVKGAPPVPLTQQQADVERYRAMLTEFIANRYPGQNISIPAMHEHDPVQS